MAELRDWLNRKVLHIDFRDEGPASLVGDLRFVFQKNIFIDNTVGWRDEIQAEVRLYKFCFSHNGIDEFVAAAKHWLALPLDLLGTTFFLARLYPILVFEKVTAGRVSLGRTFRQERSSVCPHCLPSCCL